MQTLIAVDASKEDIVSLPAYLHRLWLKLTQMEAGCVNLLTSWSDPGSVLPDSTKIAARELALSYFPFASHAPHTKIIGQRRRAHRSAELLIQSKSGTIQDIPFLGSITVLSVSQDRGLACRMEGTCKIQKFVKFGEYSDDT